MSDRRRVLKTMAGAMAVLAGCGSRRTDPTPDPSTTGDERETDTTTDTTITADPPMATDAPMPTETRTCINPRVEPALLFPRGAGSDSTRPIAIPPDTTTTLTLFITADWPVNVQYREINAPWSTRNVRRGTFEEALEGESPPYYPYGIIEWELIVPESANGEHVVTANIPWKWNPACVEGTMRIEQPVEVSPVMFAPYGFNAGGWYENYSGEWVRIDGLWFDNGTEGDEGTGYVSVSGDASASPTDTAVGHTRSDAEIASTDHDFLYRTAHVGGNLGYDVAIENGTYDVRLYFAENDEGVEPGNRVFDVSIQGSGRLEAFDVADQNEFIHAPVVRTFEGVEVTDGTLSITMESIEGDSLFSGFSIREVGGRKEG